MDLSIIACVAGRLNLFRNHLAALAECSGDAQYCISIWGPPDEHIEAIGEVRKAFSDVQIRQVSDEPYFPLPQAYNAALEAAEGERILVIGADVVVPPTTFAWAHRKGAWIADCVGTGGQVIISAERSGAWPNCMSIDAADLWAIGGWDETFSDGVVFDDADLALRLIAYGVTFHWDHNHLVLHQDHPRAHGADRVEHKRRNKHIIVDRLNGHGIGNIWPAWWTELNANTPKPMPKGDGIERQEALRKILRERGYPIVAERTSLA